MWETSRLPSQWIEELNKCYALIVPNEWNRQAFKDSGITRPIHIVPLYVTEDYYPKKTFPQGTVFGAAARMSHGGIRKGMEEVIAGFQKAFPSEHDVSLRIKIFPDCNLRPVFDSRIQVIRAFLNHTTMREWYQSLSAFVSASRGEGWNLHLHEAMACGKPGVACNFSGHTTFFEPDINGYAIDYELTKPFATEYHCQGEWADPSVDSIAARMREIHENPGEAYYRGMNAIKSVAKYTPQYSLTKFIETLQQLEII
jgi:glycosyltransferase involved in cell wall biosynthesis